MKDIMIDEASTCEAESGIAANLLEGKLDSVLPRSSLDEIAPSQCNSDLSSGGREFCPLTPSPNGETAKLPPASDQTHDLDVLSDCETPSQSTFNPFAPAPEELPLAPKKKMPREFNMPTRRKLNFDTCHDSDESIILDEDDYILESICKSIIELVVSNEISDGVKTPTSMPALTGIAETCPDAPLRLRAESRMPDQSICRKLEFEDCLV